MWVIAFILFVASLPSFVTPLSVADATSRQLSAEQSRAHPHLAERDEKFEPWMLMFCGQEDEKNELRLSNRETCQQLGVPTDPGVYEWGWGDTAAPKRVMYVGKADGVDGLQGRCENYNTNNPDTMGAHKQKKFTEFLKRPAKSCMWYRWKKVNYSPQRALIEESRLLRLRTDKADDENKRCMEWNKAPAKDRYDRLYERARFYDYNAHSRDKDELYQHCRKEWTKAELAADNAAKKANAAMKEAATARKECASTATAAVGIAEAKHRKAYSALEEKMETLQQAYNAMEAKYNACINPRRKIPKKPHVNQAVPKREVEKE
jgi:hypothetical protein